MLERIGLKLPPWGVPLLVNTICPDSTYPAFKNLRIISRKLGSLIRTLRNFINYVIEADIKGFFDNVSHEWMMKFLSVRINDPSFLLIIRRFLKAGYVESGHLKTSSSTRAKCCQRIL